MTAKQFYDWKTAGKVKGWTDPDRMQSKQIKDLADIAPLLKAHPRLWNNLYQPLKNVLRRPAC